MINVGPQANYKVWPPHYQTSGQAFDPCKEIVNWPGDD